MPSHSDSGVRRTPAQPRGERRVSELLDAAETVFAKRGIEGASMCEVAECAGASIGSLYQFFESKASLVEGLTVRLGRDYLLYWDEFERSLPKLGISALSNELVRLNLRFLAEHPVLPVLLAVPETKGVRAIARILEQRFASILLSKRRRLSNERALRCARMIVRMVHGFLELYSSVLTRERLAYQHEFRDLLESYLTLRLLPAHPRRAAGAYNGNGVLPE